MHDDAVGSVARALTGLLYYAGGSSLDHARKFVHDHFLSRSVHIYTIIKLKRTALTISIREFDLRALLKFKDPKLALVHTTQKYQRERPISRLVDCSDHHRLANHQSKAAEGIRKVEQLSNVCGRCLLWGRQTGRGVWQLVGDR